MSINRENKGKEVEAIGKTLEGANLVVIARQNGLNATQTLALRRATREAGVHMKVGKNTLIKRAIKGTRLEGLTPFMKGPTFLAYSEDPVAAAKAVAEFAKKNEKNLEIVAAAMGEQILDQSAALALASLPSLNELRGKLVGLLVAPATKIAGVLQAPAGQLARVMGARAKQAA